MIYDFHTHTSLSDGELSPMELIRRAVVKGYKAIAVTDHAGPGELKRFISEVSKDCALAEKHWDIKAIPGVELTHLPAASIGDVARQAKEMGAKLVIVHGETTVEPVEKGTNTAAVNSPYVDILAHPGNITDDEARAAGSNGMLLEISARNGHSITNGQVAKTALANGAKLILNSDAHNEDDLLTNDLVMSILKNAGVSETDFQAMLQTNPTELLSKI